MSIGKTWRYGDKRSNFNFQKRILKEIADCCGEILPPPPPSNMRYLNMAAVPVAYIDAFNDSFSGLISINGISYGDPGTYFGLFSDCTAMFNWVSVAGLGGITGANNTCATVWGGENLYNPCTTFDQQFYFFSIVSDESLTIEFGLNLVPGPTNVVMTEYIVSPISYCSDPIISASKPIDRYNFVVPDLTGGATSVSFLSQSGANWDDPVLVKSDMQTIFDQCNVMSTFDATMFNYTVTETVPGTYVATMILPDGIKLTSIDYGSSATITFNLC